MMIDTTRFAFVFTHAVSRVLLLCIICWIAALIVKAAWRVIFWQKRKAVTDDVWHPGVSVSSDAVKTTAKLKNFVSDDTSSHRDASQVPTGALQPHDATRDGETEIAASPEDALLLQQAEQAVSLEQYLVAGRLLRRISNPAILKRRHLQYLQMAEQAELVMADLLSPYPEESGWTKQCETHGHRDTVIYYKIDDDFRLTCRIETPIEQSMLVPLLAVCNETDLFHAAGESVMVKEFGRGNQIVHVIFDTPFPFSNREMYQYGFAVDEIDASASIIVKIYSLEPGLYDGVVIPEPDGSLVRVDYDAGILIRSCPPNHPTLVNSRCHYSANEQLLLLSLTQRIDSHVHYVPKSLVNYVTRSVMGRVWGNLLATTEEVRDGKRPEHAAAIAQNQELYGWVEERVRVMLARLENKCDTTDQGDEMTADNVKQMRARRGWRKLWQGRRGKKQMGQHRTEQAAKNRRARAKKKL